MLTLTRTYRFLRFDAEGLLLSEYAEANRLLVWTHIIITPGEGVFVFIDGKCFDWNYRLVLDNKSGSCNTFKNKDQK